MSRTVLVYAVYGDAGSAQTAAEEALARHLAACANILQPCTSVYRWEGKVTQAVEVPVLFKTTLERRSALIETLASGHSYDIPAILSWDADAVHLPFAQWVEQETGSKDAG